MTLDKMKNLMDELEELHGNIPEELKPTVAMIVIIEIELERMCNQ
jgi:hypothetical protein